MAVQLLSRLQSKKGTPHVSRKSSSKGKKRGKVSNHKGHPMSLQKKNKKRKKVFINKVMLILEPINVFTPYPYHRNIFHLRVWVD